MFFQSFEQDEKPDLSHCLLHQKLQMIQHCIFVKRSRHSDFEFKQASVQSNEGDVLDLLLNIHFWIVFR